MFFGEMSVGKRFVKVVGIMDWLVWYVENYWSEFEWLKCDRKGQCCVVRVYVVDFFVGCINEEFVLIVV